jgi:hypothetical protein
LTPVQIRHKNAPPKTYVKVVQQTLAFQKNTSAPCVHATAGGFYLLCTDHQFGSFVSCHPHLNRQNHFLPRNGFKALDQVPRLNAGLHVLILTN